MDHATRLLVSIAFGIALVAGVGLAAPPASAHHAGTEKTVETAISETVTLPVNNWTAYTFTLASGDDLAYDIRVTSGSAIDVYFVPPAGLEDYRSDVSTFTDYAYAENKMTVKGTYSVSSSHAGSISVILDNTDLSGAVPTGNVTATVSLTKEPWHPSILITVGLVVLAIVTVVIVAFAVILRRRQRAAPAPRAKAPAPKAPAKAPPKKPSNPPPPKRP